LPRRGLEAMRRYGIGITLIVSPEKTFLFPIFMGLSLLFGILLIILGLCDDLSRKPKK
jgi:hypothetical protein